MTQTWKMLNAQVERFDGLKRKIGRLMLDSSMCRENLNFLIITYWKAYDQWTGETERAQYLTPATSIIRTRSLVVKELKELDWSEPVAKALSDRGKGKTQEDPFEEDSLI